MQTPSFLRRFGSILYELLTTVALLILASALVTTVFGIADKGRVRLLLQCLSFAIVSGYFLWCWAHGGQTLAMKTWRIRLVDENGGGISLAAAIKRYILACIGICLAGVGLWWALLDRDGQFLHDRLAHTRLIKL